MINISKIKFTSLSILSVVSIAIASILINTYVSKPVFLNIDLIEVPKLDINLSNNTDIKENQEIKKVETSFEYKIIGKLYN